MRAPPEAKRRRPPYGTLVSAVLDDPARLQHFSGCTPDRATIWLVTGEAGWAWPEAHPHHLAIVLPSGEDPGNFDWSFIRGHDPALLIGDDANDPTRRRQIAGALMRDGVERVLAGRVLLVADRGKVGES